MHLFRTRLLEHLHDLDGRGAAHDGVVEKNDALAFDNLAVGVVFQLHANMADAIRRLNKCAAHIVIADETHFIGNAAFLGIANSGG